MVFYMLLWICVTLTVGVDINGVVADMIVAAGEGRGLLDSERRLVLDAHNKYRDAEGATDMEYMLYDAGLERQAKAWAKECVWAHAFPNVGGLRWPSTGQNLWMGTAGMYKGSMDPQPGIKAWYDEKKDFNFKSNTCDKDKVCGHYTQVVWSSTKYVGCAYNYCHHLANLEAVDAHYLVCNYGPPGNYEGQWPYKAGKKCTACEGEHKECRDGLCHHCSELGGQCDCTLTCHNCGRKTNDTCACNCPAGFSGTDCKASSKGLSTCNPVQFQYKINYGPEEGQPGGVPVLTWNTFSLLMGYIFHLWQYL